MKELYMIRVAVITKQEGPVNFAEEITLAFATLAQAEAYAAQLVVLNRDWIPHFDDEPIRFMETRTIKVPETPEVGAAVILDLLQNGEAHYARFVGLAPVDTDAELERIRRESST